MCRPTLLSNNTPGVIAARNLVYVQNFMSGRTHVLFLDSNGNPARKHAHVRTVLECKYIFRKHTTCMIVCAHGGPLICETFTMPGFVDPWLIQADPTGLHLYYVQQPMPS